MQPDNSSGKFIVLFLVTIIMLWVVIGCVSLISKEALSVLGLKIMNEPELYEFNEQYFFKIERNAAHEINTIEVLPKYYLEDIKPEWEEPEDYVYLDQDAYKLAVQKIEGVLPMGEAIHIGKSGPISNLKAMLIDCHTKAIVERMVYSGPVYSNTHDINLENKIAAFRVLFYRIVRGGIVERRPYSFDHDGLLTKVNVDGVWFWFCGNIYDLDTNRELMRLAGPI